MTIFVTSLLWTLGVAALLGLIFTVVIILQVRHDMKHGGGGFKE